jgi:hypothetical protein
MRAVQDRGRLVATAAGRLRTIREEQVLATLETRPNLMELSPQEFESLVKKCSRTSLIL